MSQFLNKKNMKANEIRIYYKHKYDNMTTNNRKNNPILGLIGSLGFHNIIISMVKSQNKNSRKRILILRR